jgi:hypothetical protein
VLEACSLMPSTRQCGPQQQQQRRRRREGKQSRWCGQQQLRVRIVAMLLLTGPRSPGTWLLQGRAACLRH